MGKRQRKLRTLCGQKVAFINVYVGNLFIYSYALQRQFVSTSVYSYVLKNVELPSYETEIFITMLKDPAAVPYSESNPLSVAAPYFNAILAFAPGISKPSLEVFCLSICNCLIKSALKFYL